MKPAVLTSTLDAFRVAPGGTAIAVDLIATTIPDAANEIAQSCQPRDFFVIRETHAFDPVATLHWFAVKRKSQPRYVVVDHVHRAIRDLYAEPLFALRVSSFDPVHPWSWSPGADVVGVDQREVAA